MPAQFSRTTRALANDTPGFALVAWFVAAILLGAWFAWFFFGHVTVYELSKRARVEVQQSSHPVAALIPSRIVRNTLVLGQQVHTGDVLVELDASSEKLRLREEESRFAGIAPRIASLQNEIAALERAKGDDQQSAQAAADAARSRAKEAAAAVEFAQDHERRLREESAVGGVAQIEALRARTETQKLIASREALSSEVRRLETDAQTRVHQHQAQIEDLKRSIVSLQGDAATTKATIARLEQDIEKHVVRAPVDGTIGDLAPLRAGAYVAEGQKIASVVPGGGLVIVADFVPASVFGRIVPGQSARLRLDGFPWAQFGSVEARVTRVASEIRDNLVRVEFEPLSGNARSPVTLQHGLPGSIEVTVEQTTPAVLVLRAAGQLLAKPARQQVSAGSEATRP